MCGNTVILSLSSRYHGLLAAAYGLLLVAYGLLHTAWGQASDYGIKLAVTDQPSCYGSIQLLLVKSTVTDSRQLLWGKATCYGSTQLLLIKLAVMGSRQLFWGRTSCHGSTQLQMINPAVTGQPSGLGQANAMG